VSSRSDTLSLRSLTVERGGRPVLHGVSIEVPPGEVTALLGPNGAGKSTLVLTVGGILRPTGGSILLGEVELSSRRPELIRRAGVAIVPEGRRLLPELSVGDNLEVATYALSRKGAVEGREYALDLFPELQKRLDITARLLSGGEQQMLVLAQALVSKPRFILIDELSLGLAPVVVQRLIPRIRSVVATGTGVLLIEQFAMIALELAHTAYVIDRGTIGYSGEASRLKDDPDLLKSAYLTASATGEASRITASPAVPRR